MDPQATFDELLLALADREWDRIDELSDALRDWLKRGGFPPQTIGPKQIGDDWHHTIAVIVCQLAKAEAWNGRNGGAT